MTRNLQPLLIGVLAGMILGGSEVAALSIPVLRDHTAELQNMAATMRALSVDQRKIRRDFDMGMTMVADVYPRQDIRSRQHINPPSIKRLVSSRR